MGSIKDIGVDQRHELIRTILGEQHGREVETISTLLNNYLLIAYTGITY